jgi:hypothetical protein
VFQARAIAEAGMELADDVHEQSACLLKMRKMGRPKLCALCWSIAAGVGVIVGLMGFFVVGPTIAKGSMDKAVITFDKLSMNCVVANQSIMVAAEITISNIAPLGCSIGEMDVTVMLKDVAFGKLRMPAMSVEASKDNHRSLASQVLTITNVDKWNEVSSALLSSSSVSWRMTAEASVTASVMGISPTFKVPFDKEIPIKSFNSFASDMKVHGLDVTGSANGTVSMVVDCEVTNPSIIAASMGPVSMELWTQGTQGGEEVKLGDLFIADFTLAGNAKGTAVTRFPKVQAAFIPRSGKSAAALSARAFLSNYLMGKDQSVSIRGTADGTPMHSLKAAMAQLRTSSTVPGLVQHNLLLKGLMHLPSPLHLYDLPTQLVVQNPFSAQFNFKGTHCEIYPCKTINGNHCDEYFTESTGTYTPDVVNENIPPKSSLALKLHPVKLYKLLTPEMIITAFNGAGAGSFITLKGNMTMSIGDVEVTVDYQETSVPICLVYPLHGCDSMQQSMVAQHGLTLEKLLLV